MVTRDVSVKWEGTLTEGKGTILDSPSGVLNDQTVTWASRSGEPEGQTSPEELIAAAHASCFSMALSAGLGDAGATPRSIETTATISFVNGAITKSELTVRVEADGIDEAKFDEVAKDAKEGCPVSRALAAIEISLDAQLV